jgi:signal transduction histidine kinase
MRLLAKTNIYTSIATVALMIVGMTIVYLLVLNKIKSEVDEHLLVDKARIIELLKEHKMLEHYSSNVGEQVEITEIPVQTVFENKFQEYEAEEEEGEEGEDEFSFRLLVFQTTVGDKHYEIKVSHSLSEGQEIGQFVAVVITLFLFFSLFVLLVVNRYVSKFIWSPFYHMLLQLRNWTLRDNMQITSKDTNIDEFIELNQTINMFIQKIKTDYINLKEFTENISHETQTPTAVISAKLEMMLQEKGYTDKQQKLLMEAYSATLRLKKLNQTLVTLTRIERGMYEKKETVNIEEAIEEKLAEMNEFIVAKNITIEKSLIPVHKELNAEVLNMLLNNLFINAIKHNLETGGLIKITLTKHQLMFENTGALKKIEKENIFDRLETYTTDSKSIGLGLSIMKKIIDFLRWDIAYEFQDGLHNFRIIW